MTKFSLVLILFPIISVNAQHPLHYWRFEEPNFLKDEFSGKQIISAHNRKHLTIGVGKVGTAGYPELQHLIFHTDFFEGVNRSDDFTIEFAFKANSFIFSQFPKQNFSLRLSLDMLSLTYSVSRRDTISKGTWQIPLKGSNITSYNYLADNHWHHFVLTARRSGSFEIWIDGKTNTLFNKTLSPFEYWHIEGQDGFTVEGGLDEIALYNYALPANAIITHYNEFLQGKPFSFNKDFKNLSNPKMVFQTNPMDNVIDTLEFAPGYPDYTVQATDQLKQFPLPRYASDVSMPHNFPWMDITYLHRELPGDGGKGFGKMSPQTAVRLTDELAVNWNYYIELPTLRTDAATAQKRYTNPDEIFPSLIAYANAHPQLPAATVLMQVQNKPVQAGFDRNTPYVTARDLAGKYYLKDKSNKPIVYNKKKWLSPFTSMELVEKDGQTSAFYLKQLGKHLTRKINMINENGEWFGHKWPEELLRQSPEVVSFTTTNGMDYEHFNGWMQNRFDSVYKATILNNIPWHDVKFTFYNVSAYNSAYWPQYSERKMTNSLFNGTPRSTPAFYPARPDNWRLASGPLNGYGRVAEGRKKEMALGVRYFAPFISAGWNLEEKNIRPAQWLGLLKSMVMLGADFFHVGYFNVTGKTGWPNGKGPNDPRGYIYQAAMPAYAQAMASRVWEFLEKGVLLEDPLSKEPRMPFAFTASSYNHLVLVRKWDNKYLIYGSLQPNSNYKGNTAIASSTSITLEGRKVTFNIRRQGSMYVLDLSGNDPVFYQLDGWHQYEHPWYWSKDIEIEAENTEGLPTVKLIMERPHDAEKHDFTAFTTSLQLQQKEKISIRIPEKRGERLMAAFVVKKNGEDTELVVESSNATIKKKITSPGFETITLSEEELNALQLQPGETLQLWSENGVLWLDKMRF